MPPLTSIRKFVDALQSRETHFTQVADGVFSDPGNVPNLDPPLGGQAWAQFQRPNALDTPLRRTSPNVAAFLQRRNMSTAELDHIDKWDNGLKETLRARLAKAISTNELAVKFHWELYGGDRESAEITDHTIIFRSPQRGVKIVSTDTSGEVEIEK